VNIRFTGRVRPQSPHPIGLRRALAPASGVTKICRQGARNHTPIGSLGRPLRAVTNHVVWYTIAPGR
jgi:hypothetical protein